jgi:hypothetical protein
MKHLTENLAKMIDSVNINRQKNSRTPTRKRLQSQYNHILFEKTLKKSHFMKNQKKLTNI